MCGLVGDFGCGLSGLRFTISVCCNSHVVEKLDVSCVMGRRIVLICLKWATSNQTAREQQQRGRDEERKAFDNSLMHKT